MPSSAYPDLTRVRSSLPSLTGLRWIAAFVVFAYHVRNMGYFAGGGQNILSVIFGAGSTGVSLFFVLSGFVLAWSARGDQSAWAFYRRRFARVYPLHFVTVVLALILAQTMVPGIRTSQPQAVLANFGLVNAWHFPWWQAGNPVSWSLVCEAFFYLCFPLIFVVLKGLRTIALRAVALSLVGAVMVIGFDPTALPDIVSTFTSPLGRLPEFLLGVITAILLRRGAWRGPKCGSAVAIVVLGYVGASSTSIATSQIAAWTIVGFVFLLAALAKADIAGRRTLLAGRRMVLLGTLSFPFYLLHLLTVQAIGSLWAGAPGLAVLPGTMVTGAALILSLTAAWILHIRVEVPLHKVILGADRIRQMPTSAVAREVPKTAVGT